MPKKDALFWPRSERRTFIQILLFSLPYLSPRHNGIGELVINISVSNSA